MKLIRLSIENEKLVNQLVKDANLPKLLTAHKAANMAVEKGVPLLRRLFVKQSK